MAAIIPLIRTIAFTLISLLSLVVLGICAHIEYLVDGYTDVYSSFVPLGLGVACLTVVSLPLFLVLGTLRRRVFTSFIVFEIVWFFVLWVLWVGMAGDTLADRAYYFPDGCANDYLTANQICYEFTVVEAFAFLNFFAAFIYYDVVFLYAIINAVRGRAVWTASVKEAAGRVFSGAGNPASVTQPRQLNAAAAPPFIVHYDVFSADVSLTQPYNVYAHQVSHPPPAALPYSQHDPSQGTPVQQYGVYPQQGPLPLPLHGSPQPYYRGPPAVAPKLQQLTDDHAGHSPSPAVGHVPLPPLPSHTSCPVVGDSPAEQLPLPSGYQERAIPPSQPSPSSHSGVHPVATAALPPV